MHFNEIKEAALIKAPGYFSMNDATNTTMKEESLRIAIEWKRIEDQWVQEAMRLWEEKKGWIH